MLTGESPATRTLVPMPWSGIDGVNIMDMVDAMDKICEKSTSTPRGGTHDADNFDKGQLGSWIDELCDRLEASFDRKVQAALPAAALYFLECQDAKLVKQPMPAPKMNSGTRTVKFDAIPESSDKNANSEEAPSKGSSDPIFSSVSSKTFSTLDDPVTIHRAGESSKDVGHTFGRGPNFDKHTSTGWNLSPQVENMVDHRYIDRIMADAYWEMGQLNKGDTSHSWYEIAYRRVKSERSIVWQFITFIGFHNLLPEEKPENFLSKIVESWIFHVVTIGAVLLNTAFSAYVLDNTVGNLLKDNPELPPVWFAKVDQGFTAFFGLELVVRLAAHRMWFLIAPDEWKWNLADVFLVCTSTVTIISGYDNQLYFFRILRMFRSVRLGRVFRVVKAFAELRKLLYSVMSCIASLLWAIVFLALITFLFSLFILQGILEGLEGQANNIQFLVEAQQQFRSIPDCFKTLLTVIIGDDWLAPHETLTQLGVVYALIMPVFVVLVNIGVMNILIGVFAQDASSYADRDFIAQNKISEVEEFVKSMLLVFRELSPHDEKITWEEFKGYFNREEVQAYLSWHGLDISHAHLVYDLCDRDRDGKLDMREFVLGLLRLKGDAELLDSKVLVHAVNALGQALHCVRHDVRQLCKRV